MDRRDKKWEGRADNFYTEATDHPISLTIKVVIGIILLSIVLGVVGCAGGWFSGTKELVTFQHTKEQTTIVLLDWTQMQAAACNALGAQDAKHSSDDPSLLEDPSLSYKAIYRNIKADYDRRMSNFFEARETRHIPIPGNIGQLPQIAPSLTEAEAQFC